MKRLATSIVLLASAPLATAQTLAWQKDLEGSTYGGTRFVDLALEADGSFWVSEHVWGVLPVPHRIQRYGADGQLLASTDPTDPTSPFFTLRGIASDGVGGLHFVGDRTAAGGGRHLGVGRLDAQAQVVGYAPTPMNVGETGFGACPDGAGGLFVTGSTTSGSSSGTPAQGDSDALVARFDQAGNLLWGWSDGAPGTNSYLNEATQDGAGGVVAVGTRLDASNTSLRWDIAARLDGSGTELWSAVFPASHGVHDAAGDGAGGACFVGYAAPQSGWIGHLDPAGNLDWSLPLPQMSFATTVLRMGNGDWLVGGVRGGSSSVSAVVLVRLDPSGALLHSTDVAGIADPKPEIWDMALDLDGSVLIGGTRWSPAGFSLNRGWVGRLVYEELGQPGCAAVQNSTGSPAIASAHGSELLSAERVALFATGLPASTTAMFITSRTAGSVSNPGGADGTLCLGGALGRFARAGEIVQSNGFGTIYLTIDPNDLPQGGGGVMALSGEEWHFQAWYRDVATFAGSNFSTSFSIVFQ